MSESGMPESPLDVLSRAASMVESGASSPEEPASPRMISASPPTGHPRLVSSSSFKEIHPKFRKHSAPADYLIQAEAIRTEKLHRQSSQESRSPPVSPPTMYTTSSQSIVPHLDEAPLDFSIRKRSLSPTPPPPYKYSNPLRQHSPPSYRSSQSPPSVHPTHLPVNPAPSYSRYPLHKPPAYPRTPSPPSRPPPPTYEAAIASKPVSPPVVNGFSAPTTAPTFITLHARPSPSSCDPMTTTARPSVICSASSVKKETNTPSQEDKENNQSHDLDRGRKREVTIVEESGAGDLMEEHFRKSLGEDYSKLFKESDKKKDSKEASRESEMEVDPVKAFKDDLDMSGYTVEDHFKKALGDTWIKLQQESDKKEKQSSVNAKPPMTHLFAL